MSRFVIAEVAVFRCSYLEEVNSRDRALLTCTGTDRRNVAAYIRVISGIMTEMSSH
jgi:hypothetical protein